ncbi:nitrate reductase molybdenum cofactor assembly chaperone [Xanthobacter sp. TB0136]|uniref:nitrate reductase molybdenum cofactor assembly chaperone n=1 Tax=Xanthobacter sp. TB0136 TaxID=3459177 RepID=UPI004039C8DD
MMGNATRTSGHGLTLRVLSQLLTYPRGELVEAMPELAGILTRDRALDDAMRASLSPLLERLGQDDLYAVQETYVALFDRTRRLSLHLFEHVHGESRDRGQAMVDLAGLYEKGGLFVASNELPDYLPLFLEFLSTRPWDEAHDLLKDVSHILEQIEQRLVEHHSDYAAIFTVLRRLAGETASVPLVNAGTVQAPAPDFEALDKEWEETVVTFGPGDAMDGCSVDRFRTQLRAARRDVRQSAT